MHYSILYQQNYLHVIAINMNNYTEVTELTQSTVCEPTPSRSHIHDRCELEQGTLWMNAAGFGVERFKVL